MMAIVDRCVAVCVPYRDQFIVRGEDVTTYKYRNYANTDNTVTEVDWCQDLCNNKFKESCTYAVFDQVLQRY